MARKTRTVERVIDEEYVSCDHCGDEIEIDNDGISMNSMNLCGMTPLTEYRTESFDLCHKCLVKLANKCGSDKFGGE